MEILRQIESLSCPFVFRVVDRDETDPGAGTAVLVSDTGSDHGFALTCWHNIDWAFVHADDWKRQEIVSLPAGISALPAWEHDLLKAGEPLELMGRWSNPTHDVAVLRLPRAVITAFKLRPAPISFHVRPGAPVTVRGFDRPWKGASLALYKGEVPDSMDPFTVLEGKQRVFTMQMKVAWQRGLSGGAVFDAEQGALVGIACAVKPDEARYAVTCSHRALGYATAMHEVGESWTIIREHCQVIVPGGGETDVAPVPVVTDHQAERVHRERVIAAHEFVDIPGRTKPLHLAEFYISLRVGGYVPAGERVDDGARRTGQAERGEVIDAVEALRRKPDRLVVLGEPGSGKTTLLKFLALKIAGRDRAFGDWAREIVVSRFAATADRFRQRLVALGEQIVLIGLLLGVIALLVWAVAMAWVVLGVALALLLVRPSRRTMGNATAVVLLALGGSAHFALVPRYPVWAMGLAWRALLYPYLIAWPVTWLTWLRDRLTRYPLPLYLTLNDVGRSGEPLEAHLARTFEMAGFGDARAVLGQKLGGGECLVLLDALDEVMDEAAYRSMAGEITRFERQWRRVPVVVTCRTAGFRDDGTLLPGFRRVEVQEFTGGEVERFVGNWFEGEAGGASAEGLRQALARNPRMRQLAPNPLLLSLMCFYYELDLLLPAWGVDLYERCAGRLLEKLAAEGRFRTEDKREALRAIAQRFHAEGARVFGEGPLRETIAETLHDLGIAARPDELLGKLMARTGLIRQRSRTSYGFAHLTWQEFFTAEDAHRRGAGESLLAQAGDPWWREVILLCAGFERDPTHVVRKLMEPDLLLGAAALADATDPGTAGFDAVKREIRDGLETLIGTDASRRQDAADALAALGRFGASDWLADRARDRERPELALASLLALDHAGDRSVLAALCEPLGPVLVLINARLAESGALEPRILALLERLGLPLVAVPAGEFTMGDDGGAGDERPSHQVRLERYWIGKYPVTNALYRRFCAESRIEPPREASAGDRENHPVVNVSWREAMSFCQWSGTRLPSEAEWEKAARGTDGRQYPVGRRLGDGSVQRGDSRDERGGSLSGRREPVRMLRHGRQRERVDPQRRLALPLEARCWGRVSGGI